MAPKKPPKGMPPNDSPAPHKSAGDAELKDKELKQIKELRRKVEAMEASMEKRSQKVLDAVGKRDAKEERAVRTRTSTYFLASQRLPAATGQQ